MKSAPALPAGKPFTRRRFLAGASALVPALAGAQPLAAMLAAGGSHMLLIGTQTGPAAQDSKGIYAWRWDAAQGQLRPIGLAAEAQMPTYLDLSPDGRAVFAANEVDMFEGQHSGAVSSFRVEGSKLRHLSTQLAGGPGTTNITLDHTGRVLLCANYTGGSASSFPVAADGSIGKLRSHYQYTGHGPDAARQEAPHVHRATVSPDNGFALFNDLGLDVIHVYKLDVASAALQPHTPASWQAPAGSGPRSLRFHPNGKWAYCVLEMGSAIVVLDWDEATGMLRTKQQVAMKPAGFTGRSQAAETAIDAAGRFLYAADRYYDELYSYTIDPATGELHEVQRIPAHGKTARYITLDPSGRWLLVAFQDSDTVAVFARDGKTGRLGAAPETVVKQGKPQFLLFV